MSDTSLKFQVQLGLESAQQQVQSLHKMLEDSVKIDSNGFKSINNMLNQAQTAADKLAGKMNTAFQTSTNAKSFLKEYTKMVDIPLIIDDYYGMNEFIKHVVNTEGLRCEYCYRVRLERAFKYALRWWRWI